MYFVPCTKYIVYETVYIYQFLGYCSVNCHTKIEYLVTYQEINTVEIFESLDSQSIRHLTKAT